MDTFKTADILLHNRSRFAIDCKTLTTEPVILERYVNTRLGILATGYRPTFHGTWFARNVLQKEAAFNAKVDGGGWTNGFALFTKNYGYISCSKGVTCRIERKEDLLDVGDRITNACLLFLKTAQHLHLVALSSQKTTLLFQGRNFDAVIVRLLRFFTEPELYFNVLKTGMIVTYRGKPAAYLAKCCPPVTVSTCCIAHAEAFYANCRH